MLTADPLKKAHVEPFGLCLYTKYIIFTACEHRVRYLPKKFLVFGRIKPN
ncbi:MAG: hypothetical protein ACJAVV_003349 [Alphaproteobacteria bacterium]|jgi:hypothetical protein